MLECLAPAEPGAAWRFMMDIVYGFVSKTPFDPPNPKLAYLCLAKTNRFEGLVRFL